MARAMNGAVILIVELAFLFFVRIRIFRLVGRTFVMSGSRTKGMITLALLFFLVSIS